MTNRFWPINWEVQDIPCQSVPQTIHWRSVFPPLNCRWDNCGQAFLGIDARQVSRNGKRMWLDWWSSGVLMRLCQGRSIAPGTGGGMQWGFPASTMNWMLYRQKWMSKLMLGHFTGLKAKSAMNHVFPPSTCHARTKQRILSQSSRPIGKILQRTALKVETQQL